MVSTLSSPSPLSCRRRRRRRSSSSFFSISSVCCHRLNFDTLVSAACDTLNLNVPHFIRIVGIGIVLYCIFAASICSISSSVSSSLSFSSIEDKNRLLSNKFHLIQPYYDGTNESTIRRFELRAVREANKVLFRSACFPHTRLLKEILGFAKPDRVNIIANADILFDNTVEKLVDYVTKDNIFALTRHEPDGYFSGRQDSQDVWIFYGKDLESRLKEASNISSWLKIGKPGFDNRIAYELYKSGYRVLNPSRSVFVWHIHASEERSYTAQQAIPPPYFAVEPMQLEDLFPSSLSTAALLERTEDKVIYGGPFEYTWDHQGKIVMRYLDSNDE